MMCTHAWEFGEDRPADHEIVDFEKLFKIHKKYIALSAILPSGLNYQKENI